ncbi:MAG TPA: phosphate ABC transporter permease PstA, partial [Chthoniobacteraceae bacterium]|nr:phosphate ABC transporter permease PstA [Chthoniobacteraceae bacterium]
KQERRSHGVGEKEWQLFTGNRDAYGFSFKYINASEIESVDKPEDVMVIERLEYGDAIGFPVALELKDAGRVEASDTAFDARFKEAVREANERRREIERIEKREIGKLSETMNEMQMDAVPAGDPRWAELQLRYDGLAKKAGELREAQLGAMFHYRMVAGGGRSIPIGQVVGVHRPNQLGFFGKLGVFAHNAWVFLSDDPREANTEGGIFPAIFGTFVMTLLMSICVMPFGIVAAIYLREYAHQGFWVRCVRIAVNNLAGVPSIVFGVFGLGFFVYLVGGTIDQLFFRQALPTPTFGTGSILWASLTLALMTVPVIIVATEEALAAVPRGAREASLACGASKWQTIQRVVLPASASGILTGLILAMARGAGEVAPLMLVGVVKLAPSLPLDGAFPFLHLDRKFMHLGFHIYDLGFQSPDSEAAKPMVFATTLFLILLVVLLNLSAILIRERLRRKYATGAF